MGLGNYKVLTLFPLLILLSSVFMVQPIPIFADPPPPDPDPNLKLPKVFCFRITDIRADKSDATPDAFGNPNKFTIEFQVLNWSDELVTGVNLALADPAGNSGGVLPNGVQFMGAGVDMDGRPLMPEDLVAPPGVGPEDLEDDGDGILEMGEDKTPTTGYNNNLPDNRLTNDLIPGNLNIPNEFMVTAQSSTSISWESPFDLGELEASYFSPLLPPAYAGGISLDCDASGGGIDCIDLINIALFNGQTAVNNALPGILGVDYFLDINGIVSPTEAIDNGNNVRDGFTFTVDDFDAGESFSVNWFLLTPDFEGGMEQIGSAGFGNAFGFGVINFARTDDGSPPGPIFEGNTGFATSPQEFFGGVQNIPDPAKWAVEFGAGLTAPFLIPDDNIFGVSSNTQLKSFAVGGEFIEIERTPVLLAGSQNIAAWMIPLIVSAIGIGIVIARKF